MHYNGDNSCLFVNGKNVTQVEEKDTEIKANPLALENISALPNPMSDDDIKESKLYGNAYDFSVDYSAITNDKILSIHEYLMEKNGIV